MYFSSTLKNSVLLVKGLTNQREVMKMFSDLHEDQDDHVNTAGREL